MKRLFVLIAISAAVAACNDRGSETPVNDSVHRSHINDTIYNSNDTATSNNPRDTVFSKDTNLDRRILPLNK
jgi:hypothetical protein